MTKHMANDPGNPSRPKARSGNRRVAAPAPAEARPAEPEPREEPAFERGARVRVTSGPFAGKTGVVQALVGRRSARVLLGPLPVQIDLDDLAPGEPAAGGRGRLRLTSSHRKPVPARS
ncbi:MAG: KOW motif-containing protein [Polyangiaceae bacterium]